MILALKTLAYLAVLTTVGYWLFHQALRRDWQRRMTFRPAIVGSLLIAIALFAPSLPVVLGIFVLVPLVLIRRPDHIVPVFLAGYLLSPDLNNTIYAGDVKLFDISAQTCLSLGVLLASHVVMRKKSQRNAADIVPAATVVFLMLTVYARDTTLTNWFRQSSGVILSSLIPCYIMWRAVGKRDDLRLVMLTLTGLGVVLATIVLFESTRHWPMYTFISDNLGIVQHGMSVKMRAGLIRAHGPLSDQTEMGFVLAICLAAAMASRSFFRSSSGHLMIVAVIAAGVFAPQSRGGILGAAIAIIGVPLYRRGLSGAARYLVAAPVAAATYGFLQAREKVVGSAGGEGAETVDYRARLLERGLAEFWQHPVLGSTYGSAVARMSDLIQGEGIVDFVNTYLYMALLTGGIGLAVFVISLTWPLVRLMAVRKRLRSDDVQRDVAAFCAAAIVASMAMLAFTSLLPRATVLVLFLLTMALTVGRRWAGDRRAGAAPAGAGDGVPAPRSDQGVGAPVLAGPGGGL